ncbi:uncharacterized protein LOC141674642 [Apium graveolens]|uniref:uncharacterized protein LOC141674642 n=1 Tax=Apium graveolens TaxID=4045 RepID=UPI003D79A3C7
MHLLVANKIEEPMDQFLPANKDNCPLGAVSRQNTCFQQWLCSLARHERTLKIRLKRQMIASCNNESIYSHMIRRKIAKQARMRRKVVIVSRKLRTDQGLHPFSALHIMRVCSQPPSQTLAYGPRTDLATSNDSRPNASFTMYHTPAKRLAPEASEPPPEQRSKQPRIPCLATNDRCALGEPLSSCEAGPSNNPLNWAAVQQSLPLYLGPPITYACTVALHFGTTPLLKHLLGPASGQKGSNFRWNMRPYNSMFVVASMGVQVDKLINKSRGPYVFRAGGQIYHNTSSLLPPTGKKPLFSQLYIYDTDHEISNRIGTLQNPERAPANDKDIVQGLTQMLDENSNLVRSYRKARDMFEAQPHTTFHLRIPVARTRDGRQYNIPTESEVGGLIVGELTEKKFERDIIVHHRTRGLTHIDELHPSYMSMAYPLIHPYGEDGYRLGRLLQQYIVDTYMTVEQERFRWIRTHQNELRTKLYSGLMDAVNRGDSNSSTVGKSVILPWVGYPDLFITFTCNPKWPEINDMLGLIGKKDDSNRVDIVCRVFEIKLQQLMHYIKKEQPFGRVMACLYTIEFQKRGLPHAHILIFLHPSMKNHSPEYIDKIISAEIPDINIDPDGYTAVKKSMLHGPCGQANTSSPCMQQGKCNKFFPKKFNDATTIGEDGYPIYRRRNTGVFVEKKGVMLDNRYVIPYNRNLLVKFDAHINVELCNRARSIKYLFKYISKGPDRATAVIETTEERDEIRSYLDCRYISACEACWRIFQFSINYRYPSVERLPFHLPGENTVIFEENRCIENVLNILGIEKTKFTEWRKKGKAVGRIYFAHSASGERFYMRMLLNFVKGSTSFECIRTVNGVTYPTFKAACYALGLLDDDKEWMDCLSEASVWATGNELRNLFVTILIFCQVSNIPELWKTHSQILSEDMLHLQQKRFQVPNLQLTKEHIEAYALLEIEGLMQKLGKSLKEIDGMPQTDSSLTREFGNRLLNEELDYDRDALKIFHEKSLNALNHF